MAKQEIIWEHILPDGRGIRFVRCSTRLMLGINERAAEAVGAGIGGAINMAKLENAIQQETVATCVRGITIAPLDMVFKDAREPTTEEVEKGQRPPQTLDVEATMKPYRTDPKSKIWKSLGYQTLTADGDDHMLDLFDDGATWLAVLERIGMASRQGGGALSDPFKATASTRMA